LAVAEGKSQSWLLVDAEEAVAAGPVFEPWTHVKLRREDKWERPAAAGDEQLHFMSVVMETWLLADRAALRRVFGPKLDERKLPLVDASLEIRDKSAVYGALELATRATPSAGYRKGTHAFRILAQISPDSLRTLPWASRFLQEMSRKTPLSPLHHKLPIHAAA
jgi:hypothetical protein